MSSRIKQKASFLSFAFQTSFFAPDNFFERSSLQMGVKNQNQLPWQKRRQKISQKYTEKNSKKSST